MREVTEDEAIDFILNTDVGEKCVVQYKAHIADSTKVLVVYMEGNTYPIQDRLPVEKSLIERAKEYVQHFEKGQARWSALK